MRRVLTMVVACLFAGIALSGCTGGNTGTTTNPTGGGAAPQAIVVASPLSPRVNEEVSFTASQALAGQTITWNFGDGSDGSGATATHRYANPGQYIVLLTVKDAAGRTATNDAALTYLTVTPSALELENISADTTPAMSSASSAQVISTGQSVSFDASGSGAWVANPDFNASNPIQFRVNEPFTAKGKLTYAWDFGDGSSGGNTSGVMVNHTYAKEGLFPAKVTGTSENGKSGSYVISVRVQSTAPTPGGVRNPTTYLEATIGEAESLDPGYDYETSGGQKLQQVYETLYFYQRDAADHVVPRLASAMPAISEDGLNYTIPLRTNVKFHTGNIMTAEDVKFSLDRIVQMNDPDGPAWIYASIAGAEDYSGTKGSAADRATYLAAGGVTVKDDHTVVIKLSHPDPAWLFKLAFTGASIVDKKAVCLHKEADFGADCLPAPGNTRHPWMDTHEVGTGPFQLEAWIPGQEMVLKRYNDYWDTAHKPTLEKVIFKKVGDINTRLLMIFSGEADGVYVPVDHDVDVQGKGLEIADQPSWNVAFIGYNEKFCGGPSASTFQSCMTTNGADAPKGANGQTDVLFFSDIHMRKAWTYAFDYATYYNDIVKKHGKMLNGPLPEGIFGFDKTIEQPKQDMAKAVSEFKLTNHSDGFKVTIYFNSDNTVREKTAGLLAQNIKAMCQQAGASCDVSAQGLDWSTAFLPKQRAKALPVFYLGWAPDYAFPDNYVVTFAHSQLGVYGKRVGYANPALDAKLDELLRTTDEAKLKTGYSDAVTTLNGDFVFLWLAQTASYHVAKPWVKGYYYNPMMSGAVDGLIGDFAAISKG